jgi:hypothetical protein
MLDTTMAIARDGEMSFPVSKSFPFLSGIKVLNKLKLKLQFE